MALVLAKPKNSHKKKRAQDTTDVALINDELFVDFFKYLNDRYSFEIFDNFYHSTKRFYLDLIYTLSSYYDSIDEQDKRVQLENLSKITSLIAEYRIDFVDYLNDYYMDEFNHYFKTKQADINCLNHNKNGNCIFSQIQFEWTIRIKNMDTYYIYITECNSKKYIQKESNGWFSSLFKSITLEKVVDNALEFHNPNYKNHCSDHTLSSSCDNFGCQEDLTSESENNEKDYIDYGDDDDDDQTEYYDCDSTQNQIKHNLNPNFKIYEI